MKWIIDARGFRVEIEWAALKSLCAEVTKLLKALLPLVMALATLVTAPVVHQLGQSFGWW